MAKYNAAKHRIESDNGRVLATLTEHVETAKAWEIADWWGGDYEEIENLHAEINNADFNLERVKANGEAARDQLHKVEGELADAKLRIEDLESEIEALKEKGAPDA